MRIPAKTYAISDMLRLPFQSSPLFASFTGALILLGGLIPTLQIVVTARFIDVAMSIVRGQASVGLIYPSLLGVVGLIAFMWISGELKKFTLVRLELAIREKFRTAIVEKRARLSYRHIENHETWDLISRVSAAPEAQLKGAYTELLMLVSTVLQVSGVLILLVAQVWWAALLIVAFSVPLFALAIKSGKATYQANREVSKVKRRTEYLSGVLTGRDGVDERALFGYSDAVGATWYSQYEEARKVEFKTERSWFVKMKTGSVLTALISILILFVLLNPVLSGEITIGMFIALVNAVFGLVQFMSWEFTRSVDQLAKNKEYLNDLTAFAALEEADGASAPPALPTPVFQSLEFRDVSFTYPGLDKKILDGMTFRIEAGRHYAFVGINGAGKTTITKLLTGLYQTCEGTIYLNDRPITEYSQSELKAFYSVVYQDFAKYFISVQENIAVGDIHTMADPSSLNRIDSAIDHVGLRDAINKLPHGLHTPLGKIKADGQDVSGGEWQRIAMARALLNPAPLRILDEPTAALDPLSESKLYEEFEQISRDKTTLFISHRLGSTKLADEIFVIGDGRVIERGSHRELMSRDGVYAEMYESQRSWYQS